MNRRALVLGTAALVAVVGNGVAIFWRARPRHPRFAIFAQKKTKDALASLAAGRVSLVETEGVRGALVGLERAPRRAGAPVVVHFPGNSDRVLDESKGQLESLLGDSDAGYITFAPSGFDASEGVASYAALVEDVVPVLAFARARHPSSPLCLSGFSLGTLPALVARHLLVDGQEGEPAPTVLFAPFTVIELGHAGFMGRVWNVETLDARIAAAQPGGPLAVVHGAKDASFPVDMGRALAEAAGRRAELTVVDDAAHLDLPAHPRARAVMSGVLAALDRSKS